MIEIRKSIKPEEIELMRAFIDDPSHDKIYGPVRLMSAEEVANVAANVDETLENLKAVKTKYNNDSSLNFYYSHALDALKNAVEVTGKRKEYLKAVVLFKEAGELVTGTEEGVR